MESAFVYRRLQLVDYSHSTMCRKPVWGERVYSMSETFSIATCFISCNTLCWIISESEAPTGFYMVQVSIAQSCFIG